jgi:uncharacterized phage protein (TIGR02218 family)
VSRTIPIDLMEHYATGVTSVTKLAKMRFRDGTLRGFSMADHTIRYTDGPDGEIVYPYFEGVDISAFDQSASLSVDNAILSGIIATGGITEQQIRAGIFNGARYWVYELNYLDLAAGHYIWSSGKCGKTRFDGTAFHVEMRSKTQQLKQPISELYLLTCPIGYGTPPCGKDLEWFSAEVATVSPVEPDRIVTVTGDSTWPDGEQFRGGVLRVLTGDNAGAMVEIEVHEDGYLEFLLPLAYPMAIGDGMEVRIDCNKQARDEVYGCKSPLRWGDAWIDHHRGFPDIPVADQDSLRMPGAQAPSVPGTGTVTETAEE